MGREYRIDIVADDHGAVEAFKKVDGAQDAAAKSAQRFVDALDTAEGALKATATTAKQTAAAEQDLSRFSQLLTNDFDQETKASRQLKIELIEQERLMRQLAGGDTIARAQQWTTAIEHAGGVTALTRKEQAQANAVLAEASEKYRAMGQIVPDHIAQLEKQTKQTSLLTTVQSELVGLFATYVSVRGILGAIQSTSEYANQIQRLSSTTGMSTQAVQELGYAAKTSGVSIETITSGISRMERRLAEDGDRGAIGAVQKLGLNIQQLRAMKPEDIFFTIAAAVDKIPDQLEKTRMEAQIFGGQAAGHLQPVIQALEETRQKAHDVGAVMDESAIAAMGRLNNKIDGLTVSFKVWIAEGLTPALQRLEKIGGLVEHMPGGAGGGISGLFGLLSRLPVVGNLIGSARLAGDVAGGAIDYADLFANGAGGAPKAPGAPKPNINGPAGSGFAFDPTSQQSARELASIEAAERSITDAVREQMRLETEQAEIRRELLRITMAITKEYDAHIEKQAQLRTKLITDASVNEFKARESVMRGYGVDAKGTPLGVANDPLNKMNQDLDALQRHAQPGVSQDFQKQQIYDEFTKAQQDEMVVIIGKTDAERQAAAAAGDLSRAHAGAVSAADGLGAAFVRLTGGFLPPMSKSDASKFNDQFANEVGSMGMVSGMGSAQGLGAGTRRVAGAGDIHINVDAKGAQFQDERAIAAMAERISKELGRSLLGKGWRP